MTQQFGLPKHVHIVPDDLLRFVDGAYVFNIQDKSGFQDEVVYMPHTGENFGNVGFLKLKLLCRKKAIRLSAFGHLNQFSEMGILADTVIAQPDDNLLTRVYRDRTSGWHVDRRILLKTTKARFIQGHQMSSASHNFLLSKGDCNQRLGREVTPELREKHALIVEAMDTISDQEVIEAFVWPDIYIRESTWELFHRLELPTDVVCCEVKLCDGVFASVRRWLRMSGIPNVKGFDHIFQHNLLREVGSHFMGIQFLASWLKNWTFVCVGGSANLFSIVPVKGLIMFDWWFNNTSTMTCLRGLAQRRYGSLGADIPVFFPHSARASVFGYLEKRKDTLAEAILRLRDFRYGE